MPSTYTLNNGIELIGTGEQSGTWGDTTNTNFELLDTALDGQVSVTLSATGSTGSPNTLPVSDGAASNGRNRLVIFGDSGDIGGTVYVQLTPNDAEKIIYVRNNLSGSRSILLFQGTYNASNDYEVPAGTTAVVFFNGAGSGAVAANVFNNAHFDTLNIVGAAAVGTTLTVGTSLNIASSTTVDGVLDEDNMASNSATKLSTQQSIKAYVDSQVGTVDTLAEILVNGNTTGGTNLVVSSGDTLDVDGSIDANGTIKLDGNYPTGTGNVALGDTALDSVASGGTNNTAIGANAGTAISTGDRNTAVGFDSLKTVTTGNHNTAVGYQALELNTGNNNTAVGDQALEANTSGANNSAVGDDALVANTTGAQNVAMGASALGSNTTASSNTAIGYQSGYANTTGTNLTAIGAYAGDANTTGSYNTAVGTFSLTANTTGSWNTATGREALSVSTGSYNTAFGAQALVANTTASYNTAVGWKAGFSNTTGNVNAFGMQALQANTTGAYNTAVGGSALQFSTTANFNTSVGFQSSYTTTTGGYNTAVGYQSLFSNTTGATNTSVGYQSAYLNTTGYANAAFGIYALKNNTTGASNTALGYATLFSNTTATGNIAIGYQALYSNTTGFQNVALGVDAGGAVTTGQENTFIGQKSGNYLTSTTTGTANTLVGAYLRTANAGNNFAMGLGYNLLCSAGYTTLGSGNDDIRAAHGNVTWATVSDERYKKDITDATAGLSFINDLTPRTFKYKNLGELPDTFESYKEGSTDVFKNSRTNHGFIAQEVKTAIDAHPEIKDGFNMWDDREDGSQEVAEAALIPVLVKALQELSAKNDALEARIATLEG